MLRGVIAPVSFAVLLAACGGNFAYSVPFPTKPAKPITLTQTQVVELHRQVVLAIGHSRQVVFGKHAAGHHASRPSEILVCLWADDGNIYDDFFGLKLHFGVLDHNNTLISLIADDRRRSALTECRKYGLLPPRK